MAKDEIRSQEWIDKIEELVRQAENISDPSARRIATDLVRAVLDFHGTGLQRVLEVVAESESGPAIFDRIAADDLTSSMLLLHDLHPDELGTRLLRAIEKLEKVFRSVGARVSLIGVEAGTVRLQFDSARAWPGATVRDSIEKTIFQAAPEIDQVLIEGLKESPAADFVPLSNLLAGAPV